jgi:hypothetical protein
MRGPMKRLSDLCREVDGPGKRCVVVEREALAKPPRPISAARMFVLSVGKTKKQAIAAADGSPHRACVQLDINNIISLLLPIGITGGS